jgi:hypothetical protein
MQNKAVPEAIETTPPVPSNTTETKEIPMPSELTKIIPPLRKEENCVKIAGEMVEIKPTKLKYFRNKSASVYSILNVVPLTEFLAYEKGVFDKERDSDQILLDFLVAVFDDPELVRTNYDNMTAEDIERILEIFGRVNHITEKEEKARKNREAQVKP